MGRMATTRERQRMGNGPVAYANRMASYLSDAKYIEAMTKREYGRAPTLCAIKAMQDEHARQREVFARPRIADGYDEAADDGWHYAPRKTSKPIDAPLPLPKLSLVGSPNGRLAAIDLIGLVGSDFGLTVEQMRDNSRSYTNVCARAVVVRILRERGLGWSTIGRALWRQTDRGVPHTFAQFDHYAARDGRVAVSYEKWRDK